MIFICSLVLILFLVLLILVFKKISNRYTTQIGKNQSHVNSLLIENVLFTLKKIEEQNQNINELITSTNYSDEYLFRDILMQLRHIEGKNEKIKEELTELMKSIQDSPVSKPYLHNILFFKTFKNSFYNKVLYHGREIRAISFIYKNKMDHYQTPEDYLNFFNTLVENRG